MVMNNEQQRRKKKLIGDVDSYYETIMDILEKKTPLQYYRCGACGGPVAYELCCAWCGTNDPMTKKDDPQEKTCLTCMFEPKWSCIIGDGGDQRVNGMCKFKLPMPIPASFQVVNVVITRFLLDGWISICNCPAWRPKDEKMGYKKLP
jgi:hypothetical protein